MLRCVTNGRIGGLLDAADNYQGESVHLAHEGARVYQNHTFLSWLSLIATPVLFVSAAKRHLRYMSRHERE